ncbi:MAG: DUF4160 domain-containing protein [Chloroflexota bacterium]
MPTIIIEGYKFQFWSSDCTEPPHVHVAGGRKKLKIWLSPVRIASFREYNERELNRILRLTRAHRAHLLEAWHEHCGKN